MRFRLIPEQKGHEQLVMLRSTLCDARGDTSFTGAVHADTGIMASTEGSVVVTSADSGGCTHSIHVHIRNKATGVETHGMVRTNDARAASRNATDREIWVQSVR